LHIGGARTAIFNWLLARHAKGKFILRLEDTDMARSTREMTEEILKAMHWLGLDWDEGPYYQSQRFDLYHEHIEYLLQTGKAYYCDCTPEEVEAMREKARQRGEKPKYDGKCRERGLGPGKDRVVRLKSPLIGETGFEDMIRGFNSVSNQELDDFVLRRADNTPTYNLAVVVDDAKMGITHILRGDDHMSNTPKQVLLYEALDYPIPKFGHVPMILGPDKKKLSKRHGATSVLVYKEMGYLPEAMLNYLVRLGWSFGDQEIFSLQELTDKFSIENIGKSACVFDQEKLSWVNSQHIIHAQPERLADILPEYLEKKEIPVGDKDYLLKIIPLLQPRAKTMLEFADMASFFLVEDNNLEYDAQLISKFITPESKQHLKALKDRFEKVEDFTQKRLEEVIASYLEEKNIKFKVLAQPIRVAITGRKASPGLFETMELLGKDRVLNRFTRVLNLAID
jgi:glutamyl-tRNA synthetase